MPLTNTAHILTDDRGVAWIDDSNVKVIEVVLDRLAYGWSPEELHFQQPHLSLAQIHAALAYYYDHQLELDDELRKRLAEVDRLAAGQRTGWHAKPGRTSSFVISAQCSGVGI
jgi:uncharacterized protein (DUF433 family)